MGTAGDRAVLHSIFHPQSPLREAIAEEQEQEQEQEDGAFEPELLEQALALEIQGITAAESGDLDKALERFGQAVRLLPERASAYNNRAQALRLKGDVAGAMEDLAVALELSKGAGRVARQALVQRGLLQRLQGHDEAARKDFAEAARLGSAFARQQLVLMNPYAALCNQMLSEVMKKLQGPGAPSQEPSQEQLLPGSWTHPAGRQAP
ncbi:tetratricopeptide repeat protein 36 isoform X2 [Eublepharis macularius]|uniref:Tetratricopeptide repeat protein 36 n=1 Tax=Eublepharis macularius TaxID=481883 RepID=A0AA97KFD6_EUBMA|nr:tetratricopeptide repeat protein 36 isoform X2 [Eublepharis macularius]